MTDTKKKELFKQVQQIRALGYLRLNFREFEYVDTKTNGIILCAIHQCKFSQNLNNLKKGYGCPKCKAAIKKLKKLKRIEKELRAEIAELIAEDEAREILQAVREIQRKENTENALPTLVK